MSFTEYTKESWKGSVITSPLPPVLVSCGTEEKPNVLTVAWTGILCTQPPVTYISLRKERFSYDIIKDSGEFVINLPTAELVRAVDYCGVKSGRDTDKLKDTGLKVSKASEVTAPIIVQSPVNVECRVREIVPLGTHDMFIADIVKVDAAKELLDDKGRLALERAGLLAYAHGGYFPLGAKLGSFGFTVRKNKKKKKHSKGK
ncbi:NADH-FMN oxidoreductase RutF, flavin reductase (DIM6/NTAB) family [Ruminococcaceae bacterium FB2012]|nr:NADH-FMN oxidoreductase RutF, flavin reductase (DIM6/NTAB) family [Ruminococcaceae bacterium FB2012]